MGFEVGLIEFLQKASTPFLDWLMYLISFLGDEIFVIIIAVIIYWCISKRDGFKFLIVYFMSAGIIGLIKSVIKRPRPYNAYDDRVNAIKQRTTGYSMPSGHSHSITNISTQCYLLSKTQRQKKSILITGIIVSVLVMFSRIYLGQHYLTDVLVGGGLGILLAILFSYLFNFLNDKEHVLTYIIFPVCIIGIVIVLSLGLFTDSTKVLKILSVAPFFTLGYLLEKKYVKYNVNNKSIIVQAIKVVCGLLVVIAIIYLVEFLFFDKFVQLQVILTYAIIGVWVSVIAPMIFKKLGI